MLEGRPNIRRRVGSARVGSTRVGSARPASGRVGSARPSSDTQRPKLHTGRPSSAPIPSRPSSAPVPARPEPFTVNKVSLSPAKFKSHDVSHLHLKVEGKSIRSVAYTPRHHLPVSRGSLRVISSHGYSAPANRKQFIPSYKGGFCEKQDLASDSEGSTVTGFGSTYTLPISGNHPIVYGTGVSFQQPYGVKPMDFGATYTKNESDTEPNLFNNTYTLKTPADATDTDEHEFSNRNLRWGPEGRDERLDSYHDHHETVYGDDTKLCSADVSRYSTCERGILSENTYNIRPQLVSQSHDVDGNDTYNTNGGGRHFRRDFDTTSNDGSECTVMSLGRKIQLMASAQPKKQKQAEASEENWDGEWKELLKQNHELLLKLSSREEPQESSSKCDHAKTITVHHSGVQTQLSDPKDSEQVNVLPSKMSEKETFEDNCEREELGQAEVSRDKSSDSPELECVLEDIIEESSLSDKSTPRSTVDLGEAESEPHKVDDKFEERFDTFVQVETDTMKEDNQQERESSGKTTSALPAKTAGVTPGSLDFACTTDLPTHRSGSAAAFVARSRWASEKRVRSQASKDLLDALQMLEDEEKKSTEAHEQEQPKFEVPVVYYQDAGVNTKKLSMPSYEGKPMDSMSSPKRLYFSKETETRIQGSSTPTIPYVAPVSKTPPPTFATFAKSSSTPSPTQASPTSIPKSSGTPSPRLAYSATMPVLQVLVEKVFLFTQDLAERWQQGNTEGSKEDLLHQIVEAEKLLENICILEKQKEDPKKSPELHSQCVEKVRSKQEEMESRIQKNLELIRKLLDDKKSLTEHCEKLVRDQRIMEKKNADKIKLMEDRHAQELKSLRERIVATEQEKRDKWTQQKTKAIKETTYRGVETKMKDMAAQHRDEISQLKAQHWEATREAEQKLIEQLRAQEEELKKKFELEKEEACRKEREREQQRLELEIRQCEQLSLSRLEGVRKQQERDIKCLIEEHHRTLDRERSDHSSSLKESQKEKERLKEDCEEKLRLINRKHEEELTEHRQKDEKSRSEWREQFMKEHNEARAQSEKELRERLKRQRDKEIERVIKEIQQETSSRENEEHRAFENKMKNLRERYENELNELESSERAARSRYLEMKSLLAQKEEEIVYMRARLHTQDLELCELQHMFRPPDD